MVALERAPFARALAAGSLAAGILGAACGAPPPAPRTVPTPPPSDGGEVQPAPDLGTPAPPLRPERREPEKPKPVVEIESTDPEVDKHQSLVEAAAAERNRRSERSRTPIAVIDNENLGTYAERGDLTYADPAEVAPEVAAAEALEDDRGQAEYWSDQARELRLAWSQVVDERQDLEEEAAALRNRFYAEDDPFVRDGKIKPEWDRVLDRISETKREEELLRQELDDLYEQASLAGADLDWLDESRDLAPATDESDGSGVGDELPSHEVLNPPVVEDEDPNR